MVQLWRLARCRRHHRCRLSPLPIRVAVLDAMGIFLAGLSRHDPDAGLVLAAAGVGLPPEDQPALWRTACFVIGVMSIYAVLQTHIDYFAQHMFFVHRWAHFVLHHAGAFLIALGAAGPVLRAGMPEFLLPLLDARPCDAVSMSCSIR